MPRTLLNILASLILLCACACQFTASQKSATTSGSKLPVEVSGTESNQLQSELKTPATLGLRDEERQRLGFNAVTDAALRDFVRSYERAPASFRELTQAGFIFYEPLESGTGLIAEWESGMPERSTQFLLETRTAHSRWFSPDARRKSLDYYQQLAATDPTPNLPDQGFFFRSKHPADRRLSSFGAQTKALFARWFLLHEEAPSSMEQLLTEFGLSRAAYWWQSGLAPAASPQWWAIVRWNPQSQALRTELCPGLIKPLVNEVSFIGGRGNISTNTKALDREELRATYPAFAIVITRTSEHPAISAEAQNVQEHSASVKDIRGKVRG